VARVELERLDAEDVPGEMPLPSGRMTASRVQTM
jgi:hypothetical protein